MLVSSVVIETARALGCLVSRLSRVVDVVYELLDLIQDSKVDLYVN